MRSPLLAVLLLAAPPALASGSQTDPDVASLYVLSTEGSTTVLKAGQPGTFVLSIRTTAGAHISEDAPMKLSVTGSGGVQPGKSLLSRSDAKPLPKPTGPADPRFEVPLTASSKGQGAVEAKLTFFVCTDTLCSRQQRTVSLPVTVD